jgi:hypothetical protein
LLKLGWGLKEATLGINGEVSEENIEELSPKIVFWEVLPNVPKKAPVLLDLQSPVLRGRLRCPSPPSIVRRRDKLSQISNSSVWFSIDNTWVPDAALEREIIPDDAVLTITRRVNCDFARVARRSFGNHCLS